MLENQKIRPAQVIGPLGESLTLDSLPAPSTKSTRQPRSRSAEKKYRYESQLNAFLTLPYSKRPTPH